MREMKDSGVEWIGKIPVGWKIVKIKNVADINMGQSPNGDDISDEGNLLFMQGNTDFGLKYPTPRLYCDKCPKKSRIGDILMSVRAPVGEMNISDKVYGIGRGLCSIKPKSIEREYLWYYMLKSKSDFNYYSNGSTFDSITLSVIFNFPIPIPSLSTQQKISAYLNDKCTKIDSIIEKQEKVIEKLKAYKLSVLTEAVTKGLNPDVKMKESGVQWIGEIPEHWEQTALKVGLADIQTGPFGSQLHAEDYIENGIYVINPANIINGKIVIDSKCSISYEKANELAQHLLSVGDIVFARRGEMGRCACALDDGIQKLCGTGCIKLKCNDRLIPKYIILYLQTHYIKQYLELNSVGTTMLNLNSTIISNIPILIPPISEQQQIVNYLDKKCSAIDKSIEQKQAIIEKLKEYKKSLIYEVVTGKREVFSEKKSVAVICPVGIPTNEEEYAKILLMQKIIIRCGKKLKGRTHLMKIFHALELEIGFSFHSEYTRHYHGPYDKKIEKYEKALERKGWIKLKKEKNMKYIVVNPTAYKTDYNRIFAEYNKEIERIIDFFKKMTRTSKAEKVATLLASWNDFLIDGIAEPTDDMIITDVMTNWTENKRNIDYETWQEVLDRMKKANIVPHGYGKHTIRMED